MQHFLIKLTALVVAAGLCLASTGSKADEFVLGAPIEMHGLKVSAVYALGVTVQPRMPMPAMGRDVIHLEADVEATSDNKHGFGAGDWIPYLNITYLIRKKGGDWAAMGPFLPMVARDGPHYAANVSLAGAGEYHLMYRIAPPVVMGFLRHADDESGIKPWWPPFEVAWEVVYPGKPIKD